jgi:hypothetical protein
LKPLAEAKCTAHVQVRGNRLSEGGVRTRQAQLRKLADDLDEQASLVWALFDRLQRQLPASDKRTTEVEACRDVVLDGLALARRVVERIESETPSR